MFGAGGAVALVIQLILAVKFRNHKADSSGKLSVLEAKLNRMERRLDDPVDGLVQQVRDTREDFVKEKKRVGELVESCSCIEDLEGKVRAVSVKVAQIDRWREEDRADMQRSLGRLAESVTDLGMLLDRLRTRPA